MRTRGLDARRQDNSGERAELFGVAEEVGFADSEVDGERANFFVAARERRETIFVGGKLIARGALHAFAKNIGEEIELGVVEAKAEFARDEGAEGVEVGGTGGEDHAPTVSFWMACQIS